MARIIIEGFKTLEEAERWFDAYEGGAEQNMGDWADANEPFPCYVDLRGMNNKANKIIGQDLIFKLRPIR